MFEVGLNAFALAALKTERLAAWCPACCSIGRGAASYVTINLSWLVMPSGVFFPIGTGALH
jgi:hypothetical protein